MGWASPTCLVFCLSCWLCCGRSGMHGWDMDERRADVWQCRVAALFAWDCVHFAQAWESLSEWKNGRVSERASLFEVFRLVCKSRHCDIALNPTNKYIYFLRAH